MEQISRIWEETLKLIEEEVSTVSFETWIQPIIPCGIEGDRLYLQVENEFYREMLEKRNEKPFAYSRQNFFREEKVNNLLHSFGKLYTGLSTACG